MKGENRVQRDIFAEIAAERSDKKAGSLIVPQPPEIPRGALPLSDDPGAIKIDRETKIDSPESLAEELSKRRKWAAEYLEDYAPEIPKTHSAIEITAFDWRVETGEDKLKFSDALEGKGTWKPVSIPHYGEPIGKAATYYRTSVTLTPGSKVNQRCFICFDGVDYIAHVFVNSSYIGSHEGFFAPFEFDITDHVRNGENQKNQNSK